MCDINDIIDDDDDDACQVEVIHDDCLKNRTTNREDESYQVEVIHKKKKQGS